MERAVILSLLMMTTTIGVESVLAAAPQKSVDKTLTGTLKDFDFSTWVITIDDRQYQLSPTVQILDDKNKVHQVRDLLPGMVLTLSFDTAGHVSKIFCPFPPQTRR